MSARVAICPVCHTKRRASRAECPRCEAPLSVIEAGRGPEEAGTTAWCLRPLDVGLLALGIVLAVAVLPAPPTQASVPAEVVSTDPEAGLEREVSAATNVARVSEQQGVHIWRLPPSAGAP